MATLPWPNDAFKNIGEYRQNSLIYVLWEYTGNIEEHFSGYNYCLRNLSEGPPTGQDTSILKSDNHKEILDHICGAGYEENHEQTTENEYNNWKITLRIDSTGYNTRHFIVQYYPEKRQKYYIADKELDPRENDAHKNDGKHYIAYGTTPESAFQKAQERLNEQGITYTIVQENRRMSTQNEHIVTPQNKLKAMRCLLTQHPIFIPEDKTGYEFATYATLEFMRGKDLCNRKDGWYFISAQGIDVAQNTGLISVSDDAYLDVTAGDAVAELNA